MLLSRSLLNCKLLNTQKLYPESFSIRSVLNRKKERLTLIKKAKYFLNFRKFCDTRHLQITTVKGADIEFVKINNMGQNNNSDFFPVK